MKNINMNKIPNTSIIPGDSEEKTTVEQGETIDTNLEFQNKNNKTIMQNEASKELLEHDPNRITFKELNAEGAWVTVTRKKWYYEKLKKAGRARE